MQVYEIKPDEIETIFLDLYSKFDDGIMLGDNQPEAQRRNVLNDITRKWYYLGTDDRKRILSENNVNDVERKMIIDISSKIIKYKGMIKTNEKEKSLKKSPALE